jgi:hypothetical protein
MASATRTLDQLIDEFIESNETGTPPPALFADDVFVDFTMPHWRLQAGDRDGLVGAPPPRPSQREHRRRLPRRPDREGVRDRVDGTLD